ncbi:hypothetical protein P4O66_014489 [Electrophorus voltai]|uniref:PRKC apoptosis WT1 regulator protein n=1 Tax=Electrophorus voltai TaxID=2609070 RepID=A0AAD8Z376_9TELE|nr:hypothetical protein P4O66_014489 [Electrophorus voltai]
MASGGFRSHATTDFLEEWKAKREKMRAKMLGDIAAASGVCALSATPAGPDGARSAARSGSAAAEMTNNGHPAAPRKPDDDPPHPAPAGVSPKKADAAPGCGDSDQERTAHGKGREKKSCGPSARKGKGQIEKRKLREKRRSTGVVSIPSNEVRPASRHLRVPFEVTSEWKDTQRTRVQKKRRSGEDAGSMSGVPTRSAGVGLHEVSISLFLSPSLPVAGTALWFLVGAASWQCGQCSQQVNQGMELHVVTVMPSCAAAGCPGTACVSGRLDLREMPGCRTEESGCHEVKGTAKERGSLTCCVWSSLGAGPRGELFDLRNALLSLQSLDELDDDDGGEKERKKEEALTQLNTAQNESMTSDTSIQDRNHRTTTAILEEAQADEERNSQLQVLTVEQWEETPRSGSGRHKGEDDLGGNRHRQSHGRHAASANAGLERRIEELEKELAIERQENARLLKAHQDKDELIVKLKEEIDLLNRDLDDIEDENEQLKQENKTLLKVVGQLTR